MRKVQHDPDRCIACTSCVAYCPVSAVTRKYAGPKMMGPALERFRGIDPNTEFSLEYCSNCKNCDISCPSGVPVSTLNMLAKARYFETRPHSLLDWILSHSDILSKLASPMAALANWGMGNPITKWILKRIGITDTMTLPAYAAKTFEQQFRNLRQQSFADKVIFFPGCYINYYEPEIGLDFVAVMQRNHYEVIVADSGPGIPDDIKARIFEPFVTTNTSGTGLGLAITKRIVSAHKGTINLESYPGGTMFHVLLPKAE